jgi:hypothetical protein
MLTPKQIASSPTIHPNHGSAGLEYEGKLYTLTGLLCDKDGNVVEKHPSKMAEEAAPPPDDIPPQDGQNQTASATPPTTPPQQPPVDEAEINLLAWAKSEKNYPWFAVRDKIKTDHTKVFMKAEEARAFILEINGLGNPAA